MVTKHIYIEEKKLIVKCDDYFEGHLDWLLEILNSTFKDKELTDGSIVDCGWFALILRQQNSKNEFLVHTPDIQKDPLVDETDELSDALYTHTLQLDLTREEGVNPVFTSFQNTLIHVKGCFSEANLFMTRSQPTENDSGWFIGLRDTNANVDQTDVNNLESIYAFQLLALRPELLQVLYLPPDYIVSTNASGVEFVQYMGKG